MYHYLKVIMSLTDILSFDNCLYDLNIYKIMYA